MRAAALAAVALLAACGGGGEPGASSPPATAPATASPTPELRPEGALIRDAMDKTLAACPCAVRVTASWLPARGQGYSGTYTGVYDARSGSATLRYPGPPAVEVRTVGGVTYLRIGNDAWLRPDFGKLPVTPRSILPTLAVVDPRLAVALARGAVSSRLSATNGDGRQYEVEYDLAAAARDAGPAGDLLARLLPGTTLYEGITLTPAGTVKRLKFLTNAADAKAGDEIRLVLEITRLHATPVRTVAPPGARRVDAATYGAKTP